MDTLAIVDFGGQYAHLIANRVRRLGVYSKVVLPETPLAEFRKYKGIILSGGPQSVYERSAPTIDSGIFELGVPVLGLCYGHQLIAHLLGGKVSPGVTKEYGLAQFSVLKKEAVFAGVRSKSQVWMSHGDTVSKMPLGFSLMGTTDDCEFAAMGHTGRKIFSAQFHMEVTHTAEGMKMLENFLKLCGVAREWSTERFLKAKMESLRAQIGGRKVFFLVSGGVDSTVAYVLLSRALGPDHMYGLFVDTGLLRKDEPEKIAAALKKIGVKNLHVFPARKKFLSALKGVISPEEKRKIIGDMFLTVQAQALKKLKLDPKRWVLGQGTIYPDTIESQGTKHADKIKTHHNRVPQIVEMIKQGKVVEPLAELYKDEVRQLGAQLGLPKDMVWKHPFPGPGLAVRILCARPSRGEVSSKLLSAERQLFDLISPHGLTGKILPIQSVGVQGDARTYRHPLVVWAKPLASSLSFEALEFISTALTNRSSAINRVCLLLTPNEIKTVHVLAEDLNVRRVQLLQKLDDIIMKFMKSHGLEREVWQFPTVLLPLSVNDKKRDAVVLRPITSEEAMTAQFYKMDRLLLTKLAKKLAPFVSAVLFDITNKPPATIEWE